MLIRLFDPSDVDKSLTPNPIYCVSYWYRGLIGCVECFHLRTLPLLSILHHHDNIIEVNSKNTIHEPPKPLQPEN